MKNDFIDVFSVEALLHSHRKALKSKRLNCLATAFDCHLISNINELRADLIAGRYQPLPYRRKTIQEPKERRVEAPAYRDRLVHHALHRHASALYERRFITDSYACRSGRGIHHAAYRVQTFMRSSAKPLYVCQIDISKYYASINHGRLLELLGKVIVDPKIYDVLAVIIGSTDSGSDHDYLFAADSYYMTKGRRGIPIGNLTSQLFANIYLHEADKYAKQKMKVRRYVRYMDDILMFHTDKLVLQAYKNALVHFLYEDLYLTVNPRKVRIYPATQGVGFVGFSVFPYCMRLRSSSIRRYRKRHRRNLRAVAKGQMELSAFDASFAAWKAHASHTSSQGLVGKFQTERESWLWVKAIGDYHRLSISKTAPKQPVQVRLFDEP